MTIEQAKRVCELYEQRERYKELLHINGNYDATIKARFASFHNDNQKFLIERYVDLPVNIKNLIVEYIKGNIAEIDKEIESI